MTQGMSDHAFVAEHEREPLLCGALVTRRLSARAAFCSSVSDNAVFDGLSVAPVVGGVESAISAMAPPATHIRWNGCFSGGMRLRAEAGVYFRPTSTAKLDLPTSSLAVKLPRLQTSYNRQRSSRVLPDLAARRGHRHPFALLACTYAALRRWF